MDTTILEDDYVEYVTSRFNCNVHSIFCGIPENLKRENPIRNRNNFYPLNEDCDFDPNWNFKNVLKNISIVNGYVIDYVYRYDRWSGEPLLYFRKIDEKPIESSDDWAKHKRNENLLDYIVVNGLPESFFELAIFNRMSKIFYLYMHSNYIKQEIASTKNRLNQLIEMSSEGKFGRKFPSSMEKFLKSIYPNPIVEINEYHVFVHYCYFNEWSGFYRVKECFNIYRPHRMVDTKITHEIKYDNGCII